MGAFVVSEVKVKDNRQGEPTITRENESTLAKSTSHIASHCHAKPVYTFTKFQK